MKPLVVIVCGDPGGAKAVASVAGKLCDEGRVTVQAFVYNQACNVFVHLGRAFDKAPEDMTSAEAADVLRRTGANLLLCGTSVNSVELEKRFIASAREVGIPSLAILDFWSNYTRRFSDESGRLSYLPDRIAVMDDQARDEMTAEGFDATTLVITGQPAFDDLAQWRQRFTEARREEIRSALGVGPRDLLAMFASQPLSVLYGTDPANSRYLGYTEHEVMDMLVAALDNVAQRHRRRIVLALRPHPREELESFETVKAKRVNVVVSASGDARDLCLAADLVTGMNSVLLVEACYLGCVTLSLQPGLRLPEMLPTNRSGLSRAVYRSEEIEVALEELLFDDRVREEVRGRLAKLQLNGGAAERVVKLIYEMIEQGRARLRE